MGENRCPALVSTSSLRNSTGWKIPGIQRAFPKGIQKGIWISCFVFFCKRNLNWNSLCCWHFEHTHRRSTVVTQPTDWLKKGGDQVVELRSCLSSPDALLQIWCGQSSKVKSLIFLTKWLVCGTCACIVWHSSTSYKSRENLINHFLAFSLFFK